MQQQTSIIKYCTTIIYNWHQNKTSPTYFMITHILTLYVRPYLNIFVSSKQISCTPEHLNLTQNKLFQVHETLNNFVNIYLQNNNTRLICGTTLWVSTWINLLPNSYGRVKLQLFLYYPSNILKLTLSVQQTNKVSHTWMSLTVCIFEYKISFLTFLPLFVANP